MGGSPAEHHPTPQREEPNIVTPIQNIYIVLICYVCPITTTCLMALDLVSHGRRTAGWARPGAPRLVSAPTAASRPAADERDCTPVPSQPNPRENDEFG